MTKPPVSRARLWAALVWAAFAVGVIGPFLMELLDEHGLTGKLVGLPVLVTETIVIGLVALTPLALLWRRTRPTSDDLSR